MKIGSVIYALVDENGEILGDGESNCISPSKELLEEQLKCEILRPLLEEVNQCDLSKVQIAKLKLVEWAVETDANI